MSSYVSKEQFAQEKEQKEGVARGYKLLQLDQKIHQETHRLEGEVLSTETVREGLNSKQHTLQEARVNTAISGAKLADLQVEQGTVNEVIALKQQGRRLAIEALKEDVKIATAFVAEKRASHALNQGR